MTKSNTTTTKTTTVTINTKQRMIWKFMLLLIVVLAPAVVVVASDDDIDDDGPLELTAMNLDVIADGKAIFLMFYDSECEECDDVSEEWEQLANDWKGHDVGIIAQCDCADEEAMPVCEYFQIQFTPTFYYGGSYSWEHYHGSTDYESLSTFAKQHISQPICSAFSPESCNETELAKLEQLQSMSEDEFEILAQTAQDELAQLTEAFNTKRAPLLELQSQLVSDYQATIEQILIDAHYKYIDQILTKRIKEEMKQESEE